MRWRMLSIIFHGQLTSQFNLQTNAIKSHIKRFWIVLKILITLCRFPRINDLSSVLLWIQVSCMLLMNLKINYSLLQINLALWQEYVVLFVNLPFTALVIKFFVAIFSLYILWCIKKVHREKLTTLYIHLYMHINTRNDDDS